MEPLGTDYIETIKEYLEGINLKEEDSYCRIIQTLRSKIGKGALFTFDLNYHPDLFYVRARPIEDQDFYKTVSDHSYNPFPDCIKMGRANRSHQQIMYLARTRSTAVAEVGIVNSVKEGEIATYSLSRWIPKKEMKIVAILNPDTYDQISAMEVQGFLKWYSKALKELESSKYSGLILLYKYIAEKFREIVLKGEEYKYKITSAFSNLIYDYLDNVAGIMYQSVKQPSGYNLAIRKEFIDQDYIEPTHFIKNSFKNTGDFNFKEIPPRIIADDFDLSKDSITWA